MAHDRQEGSHVEEAGLPDEPQTTWQGMSLKVTRQGWCLTVSTRSIFGGICSLVFTLIVCVGLESAIRILLTSSGFESVGGWVMLGFCLPTSILFGYVTATSFWGKIVITIDGHQGTVFTGVGVVGRRQHFDWSSTTQVDDECVPAGRGGIAYELVLSGPTQIRFGRSLSEQRQLEVLAVLRRMLRQEQHSQSPGSSPTSSSYVVNDLESDCRQESERNHFAAGAPMFSKDALVCTKINRTGQPVSMIVDRTQGMIHFQNCHSPVGFWAVSAPAWFSCPVSKLVSTRQWDRRGKHLIIVTQAGEASVASTATNYERLCKILPDLIPERPRNLSADHPAVMQTCALWSLFTALAGLMTGWFMTALNAPNSSLFLHLLAGAVVGAALPFLVALLMRHKREP